MLIVGSIGLSLAVSVGMGQTLRQPESRTRNTTEHTVHSIVRDQLPRLETAPRWNSPLNVEHPLLPVLRWAKQNLTRIESLTDYSATLLMRERVDGLVGDYERLSIKIRHKPFSVYASILNSERMRASEVLYVEGQNDNRMWIHRGPLLSSLSLRPDGSAAMKGRHYPLTDIGLANLVRRLIEIGVQDAGYGECKVQYFPGAKVNGRSSTMLEVMHPQPRRNFRFHLARVFVDDQLVIPLRYESYDWPKTSGGPPELIDEYTFLDLELNRGFSELDFSVANPEYHFRREP